MIRHKSKPGLEFRRLGESLICQVSRRVVFYGNFFPTRLFEHIGLSMDLDTVAPERESLDPEAAFTLIEVTMATLLVAVLSLGVISGFAVAHAADRTASDSTSASNLAQETLETVLTTPYDLVLSLDGSQVTQGELTAVTSVSLVAVGLQRIEVVVTHTMNPSVNVSTTTLIADLN